MSDLRRLHWRLGLLAFAAFVATGVCMLLHIPNLDTAPLAVRFLYRANHVYILLSALINLALAAYLRPSRRARAQRIGSWMIALAAPALLAAFIVEPPHSRPQRPITAAGILLLVGGVGSHIAAGRRTN